MAGLLGVTENTATERKQVLRSANFTQKTVSLKASAGAIVRGEVLGQVSIGAVGTPTNSRASSGVLTPDATTPILANAMAGNYVATCITAATNGGTFTITAPNGAVLGNVAVGATFANQIKFAIADGSADFQVGDTITIPVAQGAMTWAKFDVDSVDGSQIPRAISVNDVANSDAAQDIEVYMAGEYRLSDLTFEANISAANKAKAVQSMCDRGMIVM